MYLVLQQHYLPYVVGMLTFLSTSKIYLSFNSWAFLRSIGSLVCLAAGTGCAGPLSSVIVHLNLLVKGCLLPGESFGHLFFISSSELVGCICLSVSLWVIFGVLVWSPFLKFPEIVRILDKGDQVEFCISSL